MYETETLCAVASALASQEKVFEQKLDQISKKLNDVSSNTPEVETYEEAQISDIICKETVDIVKSLPDFDGKHETYLSWRKAAHTAYKLYEKY